MPSFQDSIVLFILALLLFGPKKLPVLARELGKWVGEFRRASNEFKMQMEEELRLSEQAERSKTIAAMEAAAPIAPVIEDPAPEQSHVPGTHYDADEHHSGETPEVTATEVAPLPIATSGDLNLMPPATGLPTPRSKGTPLGGLLESIPVIDSAETKESSEVTHG